MGDSFQAVWFAAAGGSQPCRVELGAGSLVIEPAGGAMVRWPYPALRSDIGGDDREWAFLACPPASGNARLALHDPAVILALAARTSGPVHDDLTGLDAARRRDALRRLVGRLGGSLVIALMLGSGDLARITGQAGALANSPTAVTRSGPPTATACCCWPGPACRRRRCLPSSSGCRPGRPAGCRSFSPRIPTLPRGSSSSAGWRPPHQEPTHGRWRSTGRPSAPASQATERLRPSPLGWIRGSVDPWSVETGHLDRRAAILGVRTLGKLHRRVTSGRKPG